MVFNGFLFSKDWKNMFYFTNIINEHFATKFPYFFFPLIVFFISQKKEDSIFLLLLLLLLLTTFIL